MIVTKENNTVRFDSLMDMRDAFKSKKIFQLDNAGVTWHGSTIDQSYAYLQSGDSSRVEAAQKMMDKLDIHIETSGTQLDYGVAGFMPSVPEFLGGSPESMFCMGEVENDLSPMKILVDPTCSTMISGETMATRGTAILAAVMALSAMRPVSLEMVGILDCEPSKRFNGCTYSAVRVGINSAPLDLASACYALSNVSFARRCMYGIAKSLFGAPLVWASVPGVNMMDTRNPKTIAKTMELLDEDIETTLYIPGLCAIDDMVKYPEKWIDEVLEKYGRKEIA